MTCLNLNPPAAGRPASNRIAGTLWQVSTPAAVSLVRRAVRSALAAEDGRPDGWRWRGTTRPTDFLGAVARHRVAPVLAAHSVRHDYPADVAATLAGLHNRGRLDAMAGIQAADRVHRQMAGIDHLFVKGPALGVQTTGDGTARGAGDIDLLVRPSDAGAAVERLLTDGWRVREGYTVDQASWAWRHQLRTTYELVLDGPHGSIDLHWRLDPTYAGLPAFDEVWSRHEEVAIGDVTLPTLTRPDAFAHALRHAAKDRWDLLRSLVDVHRLARDPAIWPDHLDRLGRMTLSVTDATIGLPRSAPPFAATRAGLPDALSAQARDDRTTSAVGGNALRHLRYSLRSSHHPRDLAMLGAGLVFPPMLTWRIEDERALPAMAAAARGRVASAVRSDRTIR